jgi:hypothetical protein
LHAGPHRPNQRHRQHHHQDSVKRLKLDAHCDRQGIPVQSTLKPEGVLNSPYKLVILAKGFCQQTASSSAP